MADPAFQREFEAILRDYADIPSPLYHAERLSRAARRDGSCSSARTSTTPAPTRSATCSARRCSPGGWARPRVIAETGAGQHGVAAATAAAYFGLDCTVYMGEVDTRRQALNVARMQLLGAEVVPVDSGSATLKDAINEALRDWVASVDHTAYLFGTAAGPHPFPSMVRDFVPRHRRRGPRSSASTAAGGCPTRSPPASAAAPTRSGCSRRSSTTPTSRSRLRGRRRRASRPAATPPPSPPARAACCTAPAPSCCRTRTARPSSPTRSRPGSTTPASARSTPTSPRPAGRRTSRSPTPRRWTRSRCSAAPRASSRRSSRPTRSPARSTWPSGSPTRRAPTRSCWSTSAAAATRTWGPRSSGSASDPESATEEPIG